jgi:hypothetical protein
MDADLQGVKVIDGCEKAKACSIIDGFYLTTFIGRCVLRCIGSCASADSLAMVALQSLLFSA